VKLLESMNRLKFAAYGTVCVLVLTNLVLSCAIIQEASTRKTVVLVPGVQSDRQVAAGDPPPEAVRDFVLLYLAHFDNYTPATIEETTRYLEGWLSPKFFSQASEALRRRKDLVGQSRMASQLLLPSITEAGVKRSGEGEFQVTLVGTRRVYIADRLQSETALAYTVAVEPGTPTIRNPYGLYVTGQFISPKVNRDANSDSK
jgi:hypothetical protein